MASPLPLPALYYCCDYYCCNVDVTVNGTHSLLGYADYVNLWGRKLNTTTRCQYRGWSLEVDTKKSKFIFISYHKNAGQNHSLR
jgi:hypothetical protein